jgi:hypothetical protein
VSTLWRWTPLLFLTLAGCAEPETVYIYKDLPVEQDGDGAQEVEPSLNPGVWAEPTFRPLAPGDEVEVINGFQGGTWIHLSIRAVGVRPDGLIRASLSDDQGQEVSQIRYGLKLNRTAEGFLEAYDLPLPMRYTEAEVDAFLGQTLRLQVEFAAAGQSVKADLPVVVADGR